MSGGNAEARSPMEDAPVLIKVPYLLHTAS